MLTTLMCLALTTLVVGYGFVLSRKIDRLL